jgi:G-protein coupled receptor 98
MDFLKEEGQLTFDLGQRSIGLNITLTPDQASSNPPPKRFHVELYGASGGARVHPEYGLANVTLVSGTEAQAVWVLLDQLQQPLDTTILDRVLQALLSKFTAQLNPEQLTAVLDALGKVRGKESEGARGEKEELVFVLFAITSSVFFVYVCLVCVAYVCVAYVCACV